MNQGVIERLATFPAAISVRIPDTLHATLFDFQTSASDLAYRTVRHECVRE